MLMRIDKRKVDARMDELGISSYRQLAEETQKLGKEKSISERSIYNLLDSHNWYSKMLYSLAEVLACEPWELLVMDFSGKALAPDKNRLLELVTA